MSCYGKCQVYGPYYRKDGRQHVVLYFPDYTRQVVSYPRYIMETFLGRRLSVNEDVHHKNGDYTDNRLKNLQVIDHAKHCHDHNPGRKPARVKCVWCGKTFVLSRVQQSNRVQNSKEGMFGPFCSKTCSGQYGRQLQLSARRGNSSSRTRQIRGKLSKCQSRAKPRKEEGVETLRRAPKEQSSKVKRKSRPQTV